MNNNNIGFGVKVTSSFRPIFNRSSSGNDSSGGYYSGYGGNVNNYYHGDSSSLLMYPMMYSAMNNQSMPYNPTAQADVFKAVLREEKKDEIYLNKNPEIEEEVNHQVKKNAITYGSIVTGISGVLMPFILNTFEIAEGEIKELSTANLALALGISAILGGLTALCHLGGKQNIIRSKRIKYEVENGDINLPSEKKSTENAAKPQNINISLNVADLQRKKEAQTD